MRLHENEPEMYAGVLRSCVAHLSARVYRTRSRAQAAGHRRPGQESDRRPMTGPNREGAPGRSNEARPSSRVTLLSACKPAPSPSEGGRASRVAPASRLEARPSSRKAGPSAREPPPSTHEGPPSRPEASPSPREAPQEHHALTRDASPDRSVSSRRPRVAIVTAWVRCGVSKDHGLSAVRKVAGGGCGPRLPVPAPGFGAPSGAR